jgi:hypothetical protein
MKFILQLFPFSPLFQLVYTQSAFTRCELVNLLGKRALDLKWGGGGDMSAGPRTDHRSSTHQISAVVAVQGFSDIETLAPRASR